MIDIVEAEELSSIEEIGKLAYKIWNEHYTPIIGKDQVDYMLSNIQSEEAIREQIAEGYRYFIAYYKGKGIGYFSITDNREDNSLFLSKFYIDSDYRGRGIGRHCLSYIENIAMEKGLDRIWLTVNKYNMNSIKTYEKMGFKKVEELVQDIGNGFKMDDYKMEKTMGKRTMVSNIGES